MFLHRASAHNCALVRPWAPLCECCPPRLEGARSLVEVQLACCASPCWARTLFTVRAAIFLEIPSFLPWMRSLSRMCWYWRSRLSLHVFRGV